jgi:hypothetical protein
MGSWEAKINGEKPAKHSCFSREIEEKRLKICVYFLFLAGHDMARKRTE